MSFIKKYSCYVLTNKKYIIIKKSSNFDFMSQKRRSNIETSETSFDPLPKSSAPQLNCKLNENFNDSIEKNLEDIVTPYIYRNQAMV